MDAVVRDVALDAGGEENVAVTEGGIAENIGWYKEKSLISSSERSGSRPKAHE
jgi:hypothetical protein